ncbi:MAG: T9SS type A sorting domain-containing protein [Bacteroidetes bacterium]|nr:T9SS type A sorting domain-containing protein [Bacteroidota bacterium]
MVDITGRVVFQSLISKDLKNENLVINTSTFSQGIYLLELKSTTSIVRKQFIIER